jgi:hypothetical protein
VKKCKVNMHEYHTCILKWCCMDSYCVIPGLVFLYKQGSLLPDDGA